MKRSGTVFLILAASLAAACGSKSSGRETHGEAPKAAERAAPTPDTTPIEALRTPAGLALKAGEPTAPPTPPASRATPGPAAAPTPGS